MSQPAQRFRLQIRLRGSLTRILRVRTTTLIFPLLILLASCKALAFPLWRRCAQFMRITTAGAHESVENNLGYQPDAAGQPLRHAAAAAAAPPDAAPVSR